jgi:hypothetical protein
MAAALWYQGLSYCVAVRSDGVIPRDQVITLIHAHPRRLPYLVKVLLDLRLWEIGTDVEGNEIYFVHDWGQWQEDVASLDEKSNRARDAVNTRWENERRAKLQQEGTTVEPAPNPQLNHGANHGDKRVGITLTSRKHSLLVIRPYIRTYIQVRVRVRVKIRALK